MIGLTPVPPIEAIRLLKERGIVLPDVYYGVLQGLARAKAFSIAGITSVDQLQGVLDNLTKALESGETFKSWKDRALLDEIPLDLPAHRLENIFRTNIQGAYMRGRCENFKRNSDDRPYLMYSAINDSRTRPAHREMHGTILPVGHPWWDKNYPPNGFQCRCGAISLTAAQAEKRGITVNPPNVEPDKGWDYSVCQEPTKGIEKALDDRIKTCGGLFAAKSKGKRFACNPVAYTMIKDIKAKLKEGIQFESLIKDALGGNLFDEYAKAVEVKAIQYNMKLHEAVALRAYTNRDIAKKINATLRYIEGGKKLTLPDDAEKMIALVPAIDAALKKLPVYDKPVVRGLKVKDLPKGFLDDHAKGHIVQYFGYSSTDKRNPYRGKIELWITDHQGRSIAEFSLAGKDDEVLLPRAGLFKIISLKEVHNKIKIKLVSVIKKEVSRQKIYKYSIG